MLYTTQTQTPTDADKPTTTTDKPYSCEYSTISLCLQVVVLFGDFLEVFFFVLYLCMKSIYKATAERRSKRKQVVTTDWVGVISN